jgi:integrase
MGCVYDRNKTRPDRGPNIWIKFKTPAGTWDYKAIGRIDPRKLTKAELAAQKRQLWRRASEILLQAEADVAAGRYQPEEQSTALNNPVFADVGPGWAEDRRSTHRAARHDISRMRRHLVPFFGRYRLSRIDTPVVKRYIRQKRADGLSASTIEKTLAVLSRFYNDQIEDGLAHLQNPVAGLDRATRRLARSTHDPKKVPFLRTKGEIRSVYLHLPVADSATRPYRVCFAVGVFAGLRTGEVLALDWQRDVDLGRRRIHVQWQVKEGDLAPVKDNDSRVVPILDSLLPILSEWRLITGGSGLLFPPVRSRGGRPGSPPRFRRRHALHRHFDAALANAGVTPRLNWYQGTRHTFARRGSSVGRAGD